MGTDIGGLLLKKEVELSSLSGKVVAIDAYNVLYQFLSIIRQQDGTPLKDSSGNITSHLSGILYRFTNLIEAGIKPVFVFDGKPPLYKNNTLEQRKKSRDVAREKWDDAVEKGDTEGAYKYAQASSRITDDILKDSVRLLELMGIPCVMAPSEGEAQASYMVRKKDADYIGSQDYDSLLFGAPAVLRNLAITGKRKLPRKNVYVEVKPELVSLEESLEELGIDRDQLIDIALCVGTDYDPGLSNIGPKKALKLVREHGNIRDVLEATGNEISELETKRELFTRPEVIDDYKLEWRSPDREGIITFLCDEHDFSRDRVEKALDRLEQARATASQSTLDRWF